jgi:adenine-specific DNA methylase
MTSAFPIEQHCEQVGSLINQMVGFDVYTEQRLCVKPDFDEHLDQSVATYATVWMIFLVTLSLRQ